MCGENPSCIASYRAIVGSSPRVRGKHEHRPRRCGGRRLIPACAGKTGQRSVPRLITGAHPRVCGENRASWKRRRRCSGSSPRVRGKPIVAPVEHDPPGLIPACAGKTRAHRRPRPSRTAHPRVCGENEPGQPGRGVLGGSSPRVRGKHGHRGQGQPRRRLIPACAGKTGPSSYPTAA